MACVKRKRTKLVEPLSETSAAGYLKLVSVHSFCLFTLLFHWDVAGAVCHPLCLLTI